MYDFFEERIEQTQRVQDKLLIFHLYRQFLKFQQQYRLADYSITQSEFEEYAMSILGEYKTPAGHQQGWYGYIFKEEDISQRKRKCSSSSRK